MGDVGEQCIGIRRTFDEDTVGLLGTQCAEQAAGTARAMMSDAVELHFGGASKRAVKVGMACQKTSGDPKLAYRATPNCTAPQSLPSVSHNV